ncbi:MAG: hypothetical protein WC376_04120 [Candidatus Nanoarchaeia archaeon]
MDKSIAKQVKELLKEKPFIEESIILNIANLSKVAEYFMNEIKGASFYAVHSALRREAEILVKEKSKIQEIIKKMLKKSTISITSGLISFKVSTSQSNNERLLELMSKSPETNVFKGNKATTIIIKKNDEECIKNFRSVLEINAGLSAVIINTPSEVSFIKGFVAFLVNLIFHENINMIDIISTYEDTILLIEEKDAGKAYSILIEYIK